MPKGIGYKGKRRATSATKSAAGRARRPARKVRPAASTRANKGRTTSGVKSAAGRARRPVRKIR